MSIDSTSKLKNLSRAWPNNVVITSKELKSKGYSDQLIQRYCTSGWLERIGTGAFLRQGDRVSWVGALYAIQNGLNKPVHLGGLSALELAGVAHYIRLSARKAVNLYNTSHEKFNLPRWFVGYLTTLQNYSYKQIHIFNQEIAIETKKIENLDIRVSTPERAILELLYDITNELSVDHALNIVESLQTIRPTLMQQCLENCRHILIKRLFLCLADIASLPIMKYLDINAIDLGSGVRSLGKGGKYYAKYKINIPDINLFKDHMDV